MFKFMKYMHRIFLILEDLIFYFPFWGCLLEFQFLLYRSVSLETENFVAPRRQPKRPGPVLEPKPH